MDKNPKVVALCVSWGKAMKAGEFGKALEIAQQGEREFPAAVLPSGTTWAGMAKLAQNAMPKVESQAPAAVAEPVVAAPEVKVELPERAGPFTVFGADGEAFGEDSDFDACREVADELGGGAVVRDVDGALLYPLPVPEPVAVPKVETMREKLARIKAEKAAAAKPEPQPEPEVELTPSVLMITHDVEQGTVLHGTAKGDGANEIVKPLGWRYYFDRDEKVGRWYINQSKGHRSQDDKIHTARQALVDAGFVVDVRVDNIDRVNGGELPVKLSAEERKQQQAAERAEKAKLAAEQAAARAAVAPELTMPGLELFAAAAAELSAPVKATPVKARSTRRSRKPSIPLEGVASVDGALWWRLAVKDGVAPKDTATAVRRALGAVVEAHSAQGEPDLMIEVRLHKASRTLLIGAVLPERELTTVDTKLVDVQVPAIASLMVQGVGTLIEQHSDF